MKPSGHDDDGSELRTALESATVASWYEFRGQTISSEAMRGAYRNRKWGEQISVFGAAAFKTHNNVRERVADAVRPVLNGYVDSATDRIGNGLASVLGGTRTQTVPEFGETLIRGAVKLGAARVTEIVLGWKEGEPLRDRWCALIDGIRIQSALRLNEGVRIAPLPSSSADLPATLPAFDVPATEYLGGVVLSIDRETAPSLYLPGAIDSDASPRRGTVTLASNAMPMLTPDSFCESMSLACGECVDWRISWFDAGELEAFSHGGSSRSTKLGMMSSGHAAFAQRDLERARDIHLTRYGTGSTTKRRDLDQAIGRWLKSKRSWSEADSLIELRIALEALYGKGGMNEKAFRVSTYGAWHLGNTLDERREVQHILRKAYDDASRAIHAAGVKHTKQDRELLPKAQAFCLKGILKRLEEPSAPVWDDLILGAQS